MWGQLEDAFSRMDDWIRDRVTVENDCIKAAIAQLRDTGLSAEDATSATSGSHRESRIGSKRFTNIGSRKSLAGKAQPSPTGGPQRRKRREILNSLYPSTLDVEILQPPNLVVVLPVGSEQAVQTHGNARQSGKDAASSRWTQDMLLALVKKMMDRCGGAAGISGDALLSVVLEQRSSGFKFDVDFVPPAWVLRSEAAVAVFCSELVTPAWGNVAVDITELVLQLTFHERNISWPSAEALMATRQLLESSASGLSQEQQAAFPDVPVSEELFMRLPLWEEKVNVQLRDEAPAEQADALKLWIFRVLLCFQDEDKPSLEAGRSSAAAVSARRLFTYLGLAATPMAGLQLAMQMMISPLPPKVEVEGEITEGESIPQILVKHLWAVLFSCRGRPSKAAAPAPALADFCLELLPPEEEQEEVAAPKGKPGKGAPPPPDPEEEAAPPPLPEEMTVAFDEKLVRNKAVLRGLCTHGGLLCRRRGLGVLFPSASVATASPALHDTAQAASAQGMTTLVPTPPPSPVEDPAPEG